LEPLGCLLEPLGWLLADNHQVRCSNRHSSCGHASWFFNNQFGEELLLLLLFPSYQLSMLKLRRRRRRC
jgi:hypothetical protein